MPPKSWGDYKGILPYASELYGIYQPLLGWASRITTKRFEGFRANLYRNLVERVLATSSAGIEVHLDTTPGATARTANAGAVRIANLKPFVFHGTPQPFLAPAIDSAVARLLQAELPKTPPETWDTLVGRRGVAAALAKAQKTLTSPDALMGAPALQSYVKSFAAAEGRRDQAGFYQALFEREAKIAGYLIFLAEHTPERLTELFYKVPKADLGAKAALADPVLSFGEAKYRAVLSPIGIVHLFREYFFELDSFLGPPVGHVWLSPGGTVELIEINTRRQLVEKTLEQALEQTRHSESSTTTQDDIADAIKDENRDDVKFGFTNTAQYSSPVFQDTATASFSLDSAKSHSREATHKSMRQQSEKVSSDIKRSFKTTFKTSTETTDTTSKRYLLQNTTDALVNYELRRKMRKVGVQVQDVGVQMCWQTFVDDPGKALGLGQMVHIGQPPELADLVQPEQPEIPPIKSIDVNLNIPFVGLDTDDTDNAYTDGTETEVGVFDSTEHIEPDFPQEVGYPTPNYTLTQVVIDSQGSDARISARAIASAEGSSKGTFTVHLDYVNWHGQSNLPIKATLTWTPSATAIAAVKAEYDKRIGAYNAEKARRAKEAFFQAARERIKLASQITPRPAEDLREEERTVIYRRMISQLMSVGTTGSQHVTSELIRSIFDVDKMLYFVAPNGGPRGCTAAPSISAPRPAAAAARP